MKVIEVLYPEFSNIYADLYNIEYLSRCNSDIEIVRTSYGDEPYFVSNNVDMIYMGSMPDSKISVVIDSLLPYKERIKEFIDKDKIFLITGNAIEIFSSYIKEGDTKKLGLGIFDFYVEKDMNSKHASWFLGKFNDSYIVGHRNQFSKCFGIKDNFIEVLKGVGSDLDLLNEGIKFKNFYGTYLLGPFLILNPYFTKYLLRLLDLEDKLLCEEEIIKAYEERKENLIQADAKFKMSDHG